MILLSGACHLDLPSAIVFVISVFRTRPLHYSLHVMSWFPFYYYTMLPIISWRGYYTIWPYTLQRKHIKCWKYQLRFNFVFRSTFYISLLKYDKTTLSITTYTLDQGLYGKEIVGYFLVRYTVWYTKMTKVLYKQIHVILAFFDFFVGITQLWNVNKTTNSITLFLFSGIPV